MLAIAANTAAVSYRNSLKANQAKVTAQIEKALGCELDVEWNLTLAANLISANVEFGQIAEIEKVPGVQEVFIETRYEPQAVEASDDPNMAPSSGMIGSNIAWAQGYMGAGSKVAVIDTGIDTDHQSFAESGYNYAMELNAADADMTVAEYKASVGVLTNEFVASVADQLNAAAKANFDVEKTYVSDKIPYAYNYVDSNFTVDHDHDTQGGHGSHVEGIAASNRFIPQADGSFVPALESVMTQGVAPDAQIVTMKVFGARGGAYDSDYMAAIEDAIVLGCDSANLSLGSSAPGMAFSGSYQAIMDGLTNCSTVVAISAGNAGAWNETPRGAMPGYLYAVPEYYTNKATGKLSADEATALLQSGILGDGASITYTAVVDDTAPEVTGITMDLFTKNLTISAKDNNYVALIAVYDAAGKASLGQALPAQDAAGQECCAAIELSSDPGASALVVVADYAGNETTYEVKYPVDEEPEPEPTEAVAEPAAQVIAVAAEPAAAGTLNSTNRSEVRGAELIKNKADVEIAIVEDEDVTNGLYTVTFDPAVLEIVSVDAAADCYVLDCDQAEEGTVVIALADAECITAGDPVACLQFTRLTKDATTVTIDTQECSMDVDCEEQTVVELESTVCPTPFTDVPETAWYHEAVDFVYVAGLMNGTSATTFSPNAVLTRAQMVTILYRMAGAPEVDGKTFSDVKEGSWYEAAVMWAVANGITNGTGDGKFNPNGELTRIQMYTFLARFAKYEDCYTAPETDISTYADANLVPAWATESIAWAVENGLMTDIDGNLNPTGSATRAQAATILMRMCG